MTHAPDIRISEPRKHTWSYGGLCLYCGIDRFSRAGLRDDDPCLGSRGHQRDCPQWWSALAPRCYCTQRPA